VEREFRKRIAGSKQLEGEYSGSDNGDGEVVKNLVNGKLDNLRRLEAKKNELEKAEEKILKDAASRMRTPPMVTDPDFESPPPIPDVPPPDATPSGAQRLDALIGSAPPAAGPKNNGVSSKKVSFASAEIPEEELDDLRLEEYDKDPNVS